MRNGVDTSTRILGVARHLVQTRGYNGFSYADVAEEVGVRKASIHYYFPSKGDLGRELVVRYREDFARSLARIERENGDPVVRLNEYAELYRAVLRDEQRMCLCGMLAADLATLPEPVGDEVRRFFDENTTWLARVLHEGREAGALDYDGTPETEARLLLSTLEGAMLVARSQRDVSIFDDILRPALLRLEVP